MWGTVGKASALHPSSIHFAKNHIPRKHVIFLTCTQVPIHFVMRQGYDEEGVIYFIKPPPFAKMSRFRKNIMWNIPSRRLSTRPGKIPAVKEMLGKRPLTDGKLVFNFISLYILNISIFPIRMISCDCDSPVSPNVHYIHAVGAPCPPPSPSLYTYSAYV